MRELVLHLAFSGKLLPAAEPWSLKPLKSLAVKIGSGATPSGGRESYFTEGIPLIRSMNVHFAGFEPKGLVFLSDEQAKQLANVTVQPGDVLLNITGASIGRVTTAPPEMAGARVNQHVAIIRPIKELDAQFLAKFLASPAIQRMIYYIQVGATREALTKGMIEHFDIPLPPLAEQKRIVAKVVELMALCDRLEAQQLEREAQARQLARASLTHFADAPTPANLNLLFHSSFPILPSDLRKSILTLAVQGKLVPQDPKDDGVEDAVRAARKKAGLAVRDLTELAPDKAPFELPEYWRWVSVADVAETRLGKMLDKEKNCGDAHPYLRNTNVHWFRFELESIKTMLFEATELDEYRVESGDVLICEGGHGIARSAVWDGQISGIMFQKALHRVRPLSCLNGHFLTFCLWVYERDEILQRYYTGAGIPHFTGKALARVTFPLPPLAEQRRIVAKVSELMALVDELETQLAASRAAAEKLLSALVAELTGTTSRLPADS
jgi:type I restriction enzyme S subunit